MKQQHLFAMAIASSLLALTGVQAMTHDEYKVASTIIEANFQTEKAGCDNLHAGAWKVCMKQADGNHAVARAELEHLYKPSPGKARKVAEEKAKAAVEVTGAACASLSSDGGHACAQQAQAQAQADHGKAKAELLQLRG